MNSDIQEKARTLKTSLGNPPWLEGIGVSEMGGEPALFVYINSKVRFWHVPIPEYWRGVKVWVRQVRKIRPANEGTE